MAKAEARLDEAGTSLWLTDWKIDVPEAWTPRRVLALVGGELAGRLDFLVHPDRQAVSVWGVEVEPEFQRRNLASVMMDALYAAHPTAWIDQGGRTPDGARWWDRYGDPAPERNIHNRPPAEWARYFEAPIVMGQRARNAYQNRMNGLDGHGAAEYRRGARLEVEAAQWAPAYREASAHGPDPATSELHGGLRLRLPHELHRAVHDERRDMAEWAERLLDHIGHGSLPPTGWNTTRGAAFEDMAHEQVLDPNPAEEITHLAFQVRLAAGQKVPQHDLRATWVSFIRSEGIDVELTGMAWRSPETPWVTHATAFDRPIDAAIAPEYWHNAAAQYTERFNKVGDLLPGQSPRRSDRGDPLAGRERDIAAMAARLKAGNRQRTAASLPVPARNEFESLRAHQPNPSQQSPRLR
ncbi:GNAT family N-acetyltransferase [Streptomyces sp. NPDC055089]